VNPPSGCRFHPRCPKAQEDCAAVDPALEPVLDDPPGHLTACLHPVLADEDLSGTDPAIVDPSLTDTIKSEQGGRP
jgi:hypothetical protein